MEREEWLAATRCQCAAHFAGSDVSASAMPCTMQFLQQTVLTGLLPGPGITLACVGVSIVSAVTILTRKEVASTDAKSTTLGIVLTLIAMV